MGSRCESGAAPATVSGERIAETRHWRRSSPGRPGDPHRPASQETCPGAITSTGGVPGLAACGIATGRLSWPVPRVRRSAVLPDRGREMREIIDGASPAGVGTNGAAQGRSVRLIDLVFPGDTNHHGTLFGGVALAHMDKVAFLAASRHGRAPFVTASSEKIDFAAPARAGDMVEVTGRVVRVGNSALDVQVELIAETPVSGERRLCTRGLFTLVAQKGPDTRLPLPPIAAVDDVVDDGALRLADMVFPGQTNHYGTLYGGDALRMMGKAAFIAATRHTRAVIVMAASDRIDFTSPIHQGEMIELVARVRMIGRSSIRIAVDLGAENLLSGERRHAATALFTMVGVDERGRPKPFD